MSLKPGEKGGTPEKAPRGLREAGKRKNSDVRGGRPCLSGVAGETGTPERITQAGLPYRVF